MKYYPKKIKKVFSTIVFLAILIQGAISSPISIAQDQVVTYNVALYKGAYLGSVSLINASNYTIMIPLRALLSNDCNLSSYISKMQVIPPGFNITIEDSEYHVDIEFDVYHGCSRDKSELVSLNKIIDNDTDYIYIKGIVYTPLVINKSLLIPLNNLMIKRVYFVYKYINDSYIGLDVILSGMLPDVIHPMRISNIKNINNLSVTYRYIINKNTWQAYMWNGSGWLPVGVMPLAGPGLNVTRLLKNLYVSYQGAVEYYVNHPDVLNATLARIESYITSGDVSNASKIIRNIVYSPMPREWKRSWMVFRYFDYNYSYDMLSGAAETYLMLNYTVPGYKVYFVNAYANSSVSTLIQQAVKEYLVNGSDEALRSLIEEYNGFVRIIREYRFDSVKTRTPIIMIEKTPPASSMSLFHLYLPGDRISRVLGVDEDTVALFNVAGGMYNVIPVILENATLDAVNSTLDEYGGGIVVAIDTRLAREFTLSNMSMLGEKGQLLYNLREKIVYDYNKAWYDIINGKGDPASILNGFLNNLTLAVASVAVQLGGEEALDLLGIDLGQNSQGSGGGNEGNSLPPVDTVTSSIDNSTLNYGNDVGGGRDWRLYVIVGGVMLVVALVLLLYSGRVKGPGV